jgi:NTE family protein
VTRPWLLTADRLIFVTDAANLPPPEVFDLALGGAPADSAELIIVHEKGSGAPAGTDAVLARLGPRLHHHIREGSTEDIARFARLILGRGVGVVFSAGGTSIRRRFAMLGALHALRDLRVALDFWGGASIGAVAAAVGAAEVDSSEALRYFRRAFVDDDVLNDLEGNKITRLLQERFGDARLEDCWRPCFCVSYDCTSQRIKVHRRGPLHRAIRASVAIPGFLSPVVEQNETLIDAAMINPLPVDVMRELHTGPIIAVDIMSNALNVAVGARTTAPDHLLKPEMPPLEQPGSRDWADYERVVDSAYHYVFNVFDKAAVDLPRAWEV